MASGGSDRDAEDALSKLLQMGTVAEYQNDFEMLINRVTGISESLLTSFYISGLKLTIQIELLRARPATLGEAFSLALIIEARFEAIAEKEKEHINKKKGDTILSLQHKLASPEIKGSLDADEDIRVDEVSSAIDCVIHIGESNEVRSKKSRGAAEGGRRALCYVQDSGRRKKKKMEAEIQRRLWDPGIKIVFRQHLEDKVVSEGELDALSCSTFFLFFEPDDNSGRRARFVVPGFGSAFVATLVVPFFVVSVSDFFLGMVETIVSATCSMMSIGGVPAEVTCCRERVGGWEWADMMALYCQNSAEEDSEFARMGVLLQEIKDLRLAREINALCARVTAIVDERETFVDELDILGERSVPSKMGEFMKKVQGKDIPNLMKLQILGREFELRAQEKGIFIEKLKET
ncbi:hypothetical protein Tco_0059227 [Tanacetum coccineum]